jgi:hypothetical protein
MSNNSEQPAAGKILAIYDHALDEVEIHALEQFWPPTTVTELTDHAGQNLPRIYGFAHSDLTFASWRVYTISNPFVSVFMTLRGGGLIYAGILNTTREAELKRLLARYEFICSCYGAVNQERQDSIDQFHDGDESQFAGLVDHQVFMRTIGDAHRRLSADFLAFLGSIRANQWR